MPKALRKCFQRVPHRVVVCGLTSVVMVFGYIHRYIFGFWMVDAVSSERYSLRNSLSNCSYIITSSHQRSQKQQYIFWDHDVIYGIFQVFYVGYLVGVVPAGLAVDYYGVKGVLVVGLCQQSVISAIVPLLTTIGPNFIMAGRFLQGVGHCVLNVGMAGVAAQWAPESERIRFISVMATGKIIGYMVCAVIYPMLEASYIFFFLVGGGGVLWSFLCWLFLCSRPGKCKHISAEERTVIYQNSEGIDRREHFHYPFVSLGRMLSSIPFLSLVVYSSSLDFIRNFTINHFTEYLHNILHFDQNLIGSIQCMTLFVLAISTLFWGFSGDFLINKNIMTRQANKKMFIGFAMLLTAPLLLLMFLTGCNVTLVLILQTTIHYVQGLTHCIQHTLPIDISPQHAGLVTGLVNLVCHACYMISDEMVYSVVHNSSNSGQWLGMGAINAVVATVCTLQFLWLGSTTVQPWNYYHSRTTDRTLRSTVSHLSHRSQRSHRSHR